MADCLIEDFHVKICLVMKIVQKYLDPHPPPNYEHFGQLLVTNVQMVNSMCLTGGQTHVNQIWTLPIILDVCRKKGSKMFIIGQYS